MAAETCSKSSEGMISAKATVDDDERSLTCTKCGAMNDVPVSNAAVTCNQGETRESQLILQHASA